MWRLNFFLVARCSLLFVRCSLLFARCSLLFSRCLLLLRLNYCEIKLLWTAKKWFYNNETPPHILPLQTFSTCKSIFKVDIKSQILPEWYHFDVFITISGHDFIHFYLLEESEVVARKSSLKKVFLNIPQNSQENICAGVSFTIKLQAEGL